MTEIRGLVGYRPREGNFAEVGTPPYDVIEKGSPLEAVCKGRHYSLYHVILGKDPASAWNRLMPLMQEETIPSLYGHYEKRLDGSERIGLFAAAKIGSDVYDHEETKEPKVQERLKLAQTTGYSFGPVLTLTESPISEILHEIYDKIKICGKPLCSFIPDFEGHSDLDGILNSIFRIEVESPEGIKLREHIRKNPLFIADGHHRYEAAVLNGQQYLLACISEAKDARIQAYNRAIKGNGSVKFDDIKSQLENLQEISDFKTPSKEHQICIYSNGRTYLWDIISKVLNPTDLIASLDVNLLESELYPLLEITEKHIKKNSDCVEHYPEYQLDEMVDQANLGTYDVIAAFHPISVKTVIQVAKKGKKMPPKSTYFDKVHSGFFIMKN